MVYSLFLSLVIDMPSDIQEFNDTIRVVERYEGMKLQGSPPTLSPFSEAIPKVYSGFVLGVRRGWFTTPNFLPLKMAGAWLSPLPYSARKAQGFRHVMVFRHRTPTDGLGQWTRSTIPIPEVRYPFSYAIFTPDWSEITLKALKKLKSESWQVGTVIAEARKTSDLVIKTVKQLTDTIRALKRGRFGEAAAFLGVHPKREQRRRFDKHYGRDPTEAASRAWLELSFGVKPLLHDVDDAVRTLAEALHKPWERRQTLKAQVTAHDDDTIFPFTMEVSPDRICKQVTRDKVVYRMSFLFESDAAVEAAQKVDLINPISTVYEVIPWSFLVDYFFTIGDCIGVLDADVGKTFRGGTRSYKLVRTVVWSDPSSSLANEGVTGSYEWYHEKKEREVLSSFPSVPLPQFKPNLNFTKLINGVALLAQQLGKLRYPG